MSNFSSNTFVRTILGRIGEATNPAVYGKKMQQFELKRAFPEPVPLQWLFEQSDACLDMAALNDKLLQQKQMSTQGVAVDVWQRVTAGISSNLQLTGYVSGATQRISVTPDTLIAKKLTLNWGDLVKWDSGYGSDLSKMFEAEFTYLLREGIREVINQMNTQFVTYLGVVKSTTGGLGTRYTTDGNNDREIPNTETNPLNGIFVDGVIPNRFSYGDTAERCSLLASEGFIYEAKSIEQFGVQNYENRALQLPTFTLKPTETIDVPAPLTDAWYAYLVDFGGLYGTTWAPPIGFDMPAMLGDFGNKIAETFTVPADTVKGIPALQMGIYVENNFANTFAAAPNDFQEAYMNKTTNFIVWCYPIFGRAYSSVATDSPVIGYVKKK